MDVIRLMKDAKADVDAVVILDTELRGNILDIGSGGEGII